MQTAAATGSDRRRRAALAAALVVALAAAACAGGQGRTAVADPGAGDPPVADGSGALLRITDLAVRSVDDALVTLTAEGRLLGVDGTVTGNLGPEGRLVDREGTLVGTLHADGRWVRGDGTVAATIAADGTVTAASLGAPLALRDDGAVTQGGEVVNALRVDGLDHAERRLAGLILFLAVDGAREVLAVLGNLAAGRVPPQIDEGLRRGEVDCDRVDDPGYRAQMRAVDIDPDSIECHETE